MAPRYFLLLALLVSYVVPSMGQELPANVQARLHSWYLSPSIAMLQTQRFESNSAILQSVANDPQPALGLRLGYSHSPALAVETGFHVLPNNSGFVAAIDQLGIISRTYMASGVVLPVSVVWRVWQPTPRLAVRAVVGGSLYWQNNSGSFTDTIRYSSTPTNLGNSKIFVSKQGPSSTRHYGAELGLRAEWQASSKVFIGFEVKDLLTLSTVDDNTISVTDEANGAVLAAAHMAARRHTLAAGINVRCILQTGISYRYQPVE